MTKKTKIVFGIIIALMAIFYFINKINHSSEVKKQTQELKTFREEYNSTIEEKKAKIEKTEKGEIEKKYKIASAGYDGAPKERLEIVPYTEELPPMPNEKENNSTLLGVDVNNNGVRDDLEILTVKMFGEDRDVVESEFATIRTRARTLYEVQNADGKVSDELIKQVIDDVDKSVDCISYFGGSVDVSIREDIIYEQQLKNTPQRRRIEKKVLHSMRGGGGPSFDPSDKACKDWFEETRNYEYFN